MKIEKKYEQWKSITESDFVTLFIKTWFTFIATLRELNPDVSVFAEDGKPRGDKPFLNAYKSGIMPIVQKQMETDDSLQELYKLYPFAMKKVLEVFPQYFFQTFYTVNREFKYTDEDIQKDEEGNLKERYQVNIHISDQWIIKGYIGLSGYYKKTSYNESIKFKVDTRDVIKQAVEAINRTHSIDAISFIKELYTELTDRIISKLSKVDYTEKYNQTINKKILSQINRFYSSIRLNFEKNYRLPHDIDGVYETNTFAIFKQMPYNQFYKSFDSGLINQKDLFYGKLLKNAGVEWFASFVYALRNALFHEIISPLDEEWQIIFKSAYLVLKKISDICIDTVYRIFSLNEIDNNPIVEYVMHNAIDCVNSLADHVEILEASQISLTHFEINNSLITASGIVKLKVKLQKGEADDIREETGEILSEEPVVINFEAKLYDDNLEIVSTNDGQKEISFSIAGT